MRLQRKYKIALVSALAVLLLASIAGAAVFALTLVQDATEDTPIEIVGETAGSAAGQVAAVGEAAPDSPLEPAPTSADNTPTETPQPQIPDPPASVSARLNSCSAGPSCSVTVSWEAPTSGSSPTGYEALMQLSDGTGGVISSGTLSVGTLSHDFTLTAYGEYTAGVRALNSEGSSGYGNDKVVVANAPAAIASVSLSRSDDMLDLSWTVPNDGGAAITRYEAECSTDNASTWSSCDSNIEPSGAEGSVFATTIEDVDNGAYYTVRVRAVNAAAKGSWTQSEQIGPLGPPGEATNITAVRDGFTITASWTAAPGATSYDAALWKSVDAGLTPVVETKTGITGTTVELTLTEFGDSHTVAIWAKNQYGEGAVRESSVVGPPDPPAAPSSVTGDRSSDGATITATWTAVSDATGYDLNYTDDDGATWQSYATNVADTTVSMTDLTPVAEYVISVRALRKYDGPDGASATLKSSWTDSGAIQAPPAQ